LPPLFEDALRDNAIECRIVIKEINAGVFEIADEVLPTEASLGSLVSQ
jgi:hypothetical protein